jgi:5-methylcytosine-specific restriction endonuclease McrA
LDAPSEDGRLESAAEVWCPYCGQRIVIPLDPGGGRTQEYVEDCQVCCQPCHVRVTFDENGAAEVALEEAQ